MREKKKSCILVDIPPVPLNCFNISCQWLAELIHPADCWVASTYIVKTVWTQKVLLYTDGHSSSVLTEDTNTQTHIIIIILDLQGVGYL